MWFEDPQHRKRQHMKEDTLIRINRECAHKYWIKCEVISFLVGEQKKNHVAAECCDILSKPGARNTLKASLTGTTFHTNAPAKIIFTIHSGLATVNLQVIIDGNQMLKPSAVQGCWNYSQVSHLIMCLFFGCCFFFFFKKNIYAKEWKCAFYHLHWNRIHC